MQRSVSIFIFTLGLLFAANIFAATMTIPRVANVRHSPAFFGHENVLDQLPQGSQVEVISRKKLSSGADSLEVKIISPLEKISLNDKKPIYIWESNSEIKNDLFKTEASTTCPDGTCNGPTTSLPTQTGDIKDITKKLEKDASEEKVIPSATGSLAAEIAAYSSSEEVKNSFDWAKSHKPWLKGNCYRHVKEALATKTKGGRGPGQNLIPQWYASSKAKFGVDDLKAKGFVNLLENDDYKDMNSHTAPHGAVLIYKHINRRGLEDKKAGHAEIKFGEIVDGKNVSKFFYGPLHDYPVNRRSGSRYQLTGIMIKSPQSESKK